MLLSDVKILNVTGLIRSQMPYPLGHGAFYENAVFLQRASSFGIDITRLSKIHSLLIKVQRSLNFFG